MCPVTFISFPHDWVRLQQSMCLRTNCSGHGWGTIPSSFKHAIAHTQPRVRSEGNMEMIAEDYFCYMSRQQDDGPLYLFDKDFAGHAAPLAADYSAPPAFQEDLFALLGDARPDFRWLIIGPGRSGSTFHVDPNATSAWNACVRGRKLWCAALRGVAGARLCWCGKWRRAAHGHSKLIGRSALCV